MCINIGRYVDSKLLPSKNFFYGKILIFTKICTNENIPLYGIILQKFCLLTSHLMGFNYRMVQNFDGGKF